MEVVIVGGGLVGTLLAILLGRRGYRIRLFERRPDMRTHGYTGGRSINLALSDRGIRALERAGIADRILPLTIPMKGRMIHHQDSSLDFQPYGIEGQVIRSLSRARLNLALLEAADDLDTVQMEFEWRCVHVEPEVPAATFVHVRTGEQQRVAGDVLIGADGAYSAVREVLRTRDRYNYCQEYLDYGYKELSIPAGPDGSFLMEPNALHIWPRHNFMMIALPNTEGTFTCTLFLPYEGEVSFAQLYSRDRVHEFFAHYFPDAVPLMPTLLEDFEHNPTASLVTIRCFPWVVGRTALIGDAAHAIVPFYGQGMNAGFEDCRILDELLDRYHDDWDAALQEYQRLRKPAGDAVAQLALDNFVEMRDKVADPQFLLRKKIEVLLFEHFPELYTPLYTLVTFSPDVSYDQAYRQGQANERIIAEIMKLPNIEERWDDPALLPEYRHILERFHDHAS
ncbi:MAG: NAD(P)/FAD-dependent oxidoreductase [Bacteroidota bacterium]|nr:FAD-dependent monooxygenase [Candidatus Kapabacteria bacterium]MCS7302324.1 FAD-dependent monooxygenase [Candidatus Kapabacteria bacterium]MCX7936931.1 FAD-dependent monooxygenase [Chlorobiota bacterium]MDW8075290.1 NAD(P)/FAD-dependent oxidoreductase [Bacteroidota bacterium]